jgi:hypothetical protein
MKRDGAEFRMANEHITAMAEELSFRSIFRTRSSG